MTDPKSPENHFTDLVAGLRAEAAQDAAAGSSNPTGAEMTQDAIQAASDAMRGQHRATSLDPADALPPIPTAEQLLAGHPTPATQPGIPAETAAIVFPVAMAAVEFAAQIEIDGKPMTIPIVGWDSTGKPLTTLPVTGDLVRLSTAFAIISAGNPESVVKLVIVGPVVPNYPQENVSK